MNNFEDRQISNEVMEAWEAGMTYESYKTLVQELLEKGRSTGLNQSEAYVQYSKMGLQRMNRLDKTLKLDQESDAFLKQLTRKVNWLVIAEGWCGDAGQTLPVMNLLSSASENITMRVVLRDEWPLLMDQFLTNGARSIPKLIQWDPEGGQITGIWGPRPSLAAAMVAAEKVKNGVLTAEFRTELQLWYSRDKGLNTLKDLQELLALELVGN